MFHENTIPDAIHSVIPFQLQLNSQSQAAQPAEYYKTARHG